MDTARNPNRIAFPGGLITIASTSECSLGGIGDMGTGTMNDNVWTQANRAVAIPFRISQRFLVSLLWVFNGTVIAGNLDLGIYDSYGNLIVSSGSVAQAGISQIQTVNIADMPIGPGLFYMALSKDDAVGRVYMGDTVAEIARICGIAHMFPGGFPLPDPFVFAPPATQNFPVFGLTMRGFV